MIEKKITKNNKSNMKKSLSDLLLENGFALPLTETDIQKCDEVFGTTDIVLPEEVDSPNFIFERLEKENTKPKKIETTINSLKEIKRNQNDYFKKLVLAAEIVYQLHKEPTFGHKKFVKINYVCEEICEMQLSTNYGQHAAGPFDSKNLHTIDAEFKKRKWFNITKREGGYGFAYSPDINVLDYQPYYLRYFKSEIQIINIIIELFRKQSSDFCEIVATLFAVWKRELKKSYEFNDDTLINNFYNWSEEKKKFDKIQLSNALSWMRSNEIVPIF